jgi:hypothetical protein
VASDSKAITDPSALMAGLSAWLGVLAVDPNAAALDAIGQPLVDEDVAAAVALVPTGLPSRMASACREQAPGRADPRAAERMG